MVTLLIAILASFSHADTVINLITKDSLYGAGSMSVPCRPETIDVECKIDTGINISTFKEEAFAVLPPSIAVANFASITGSVVKCNFVELKNLKLGDLVIPQLEPVICPTKEVNSFDNLIGLDFFADRSFHLDVAKHQLTFLDEAPQGLPYTFESDGDGHILLPVTSSQKTPVNILAMYDTGAAITTVDIKLVEEQPNDYTVIKEVSTITDVHGNTIKTLLVVSGVVQVGTHKVIAEYMMAMDFTMIQKQSGPNVRMILGYNVINQTPWTINLANKTWDTK